MSEQLNPSYSVWQDLVELDQKHQVLTWKFGDSPSVHFMNPLQYIHMVEHLSPLHLPGQFQTDLNNEYPLTSIQPHAHSTRPNEPTKQFIAKQGEYTGIAGLLRLMPHFKIMVPKFRPQNVLLVGSIDYGGIYETLKYLNAIGAPNVNVTLVDSSPVPINLIRSMRNHGYWNWNGNVDLVNSDIRDFTPTQPFDLVLMDIVNVYAIERTTYNKDPLLPYKKILEACKKNTGQNGYFLSRCLTFSPVKPYRQPIIQQEMSPDEYNELFELLKNNIGPIIHFIHSDFIKESATYWISYFRDYYCGLERFIGNPELRKPLDGRKGSRRIRRTYTPVFENEVERITVFDPTRNWVLQSFCYQSK